MKRYLCFLMGVIFLSACTSSQPAQAPAPELKPARLDNTVKIIAGQTVYVPIYSHIYTVEQNRTMNLTATLIIRNTDQTYPMIVSAVNYYDTNGKPVRKYLEKPIELQPLAAANFVVD